jgi:opacity protein-like surface antigen
MKAHLLFGISLAALCAEAQSLFAAELETPAPSQRAAPAAERPRAPAQQRAAQPRPQQSAQPSQASWTGSQAGGFGGGNAGGGSFSDPFGVCALGVNRSTSGGACPQSNFNFGQGGKAPGIGGVAFGYNIPLGNQFVIGLEGNVAGGKVTGSSSSTNVHSTASVDSVTSMTTETFQGTLTQGSNAALRVRFGVPIANYTALIYGLAGVAVGKVAGSFNYSASNFGQTIPFNPPCPAFNSCATNVFGSASFDRTRVGFSGGGGIEWMTGIPGITIDIAYKFTTFGSFSEDVPLIVANCQFFAIGPCSNGIAHIDLNHLSSQSVTAGVNYHTNQNNAPGAVEQSLAAIAVAAGAVAAVALPSAVPADQATLPMPGTLQQVPVVRFSGSRSFTGGVFFGHNTRLGKNLVIGVEADFAWKRLNASTTGTNTTFDNFAPALLTEVISGQVGQKWDASLRARFGAFVTPSMMTYVTGGVAFGNVNGSYSYSGIANDSATFTTTAADTWSFTRVGWTLGTGLEVPISGGWKMRLEYRFTDLGSFQRAIPLTRTCTSADVFVTCTELGGNAGPTVAPVTQEASFQTIRFGLSYSFDGFDLGFNLGGSGGS